MLSLRAGLFFLLFMCISFPAQSSILKAIFEGGVSGRKAIVKMMVRMGRAAGRDSEKAADEFMFMVVMLGEDEVKKYRIFSENFRIEDITNKDILEISIKFDEKYPNGIGLLAHYEKEILKKSDCSVSGLLDNWVKKTGKKMENHLRYYDESLYFSRFKEKDLAFGYYGNKTRADKQHESQLAEEIRGKGRRLLRQHRSGDEDWEAIRRCNEDLEKFIESPEVDIVVKYNTMNKLSFKRSSFLEREKELAKAIMLFSTVDGVTFYSSNNVIYLINYPFDKEVSFKLANLLKKIAKEKPIDPTNGRTENLNIYFRKIIKDHPELQILHQKFGNHRCLP